MSETIYKGATIRVSQDEFAENPRQWGIGTFLTADWSNEAPSDVLRAVREEINFNTPEKKAIQDSSFVRERLGSRVVWYHRLYRYSHGNDVYALHRNFPDQRWDLSWVGYVIVTAEDIKRHFNRQRMSDKLAEEIYSRVSADLDDYTNYVNGWVYGFMVKDSGIFDLDDVFYGGYNDPDEALENAQAMIDQMLESSEAYERHEKREQEFYA